MSGSSEFLTSMQQALGEKFIEKGYIVQPVDDLALLDRIRDRIAEIAATHLGAPTPNDAPAFLDRIADQVTVPALNALRLAVIDGINAEGWLRPSYFGLARSTIETIVGNELVMQRRINLSIQLPADDSSLLPVHADSWSGDSPFEVVVWVPLVDCYKTKSMFLLPPAGVERLRDNFDLVATISSEDLFRRIEPELEWIDISYGEVLLFNQNLPHGNRVNREADTRWSMNCRFKSVFSPYGDKKLGEFFLPITLRPATRIGMAHRFPVIGDE